MNFIKIKNVCVSKELIKNMKRQQNGIIFANNISNKSIITRIYKELLQIYNKETSSPI